MRYRLLLWALFFVPGCGSQSGSSKLQINNDKDGAKPAVATTDLQSAKRLNCRKAIEEAKEASAQDNFDKAFSKLERAEEDCGFTSETRYWRMHITTQQNKRELMQRAKVSMSTGDLRYAVECLERAIQWDADEELESQLRFAKARLKFEDAEKAFRAGNQQLAMDLARTSIWFYRTDEAEALLKQFATSQETRR